MSLSFRQIKTQVSISIIPKKKSGLLKEILISAIIFCRQSIVFDQFVIQAGADFSGVATEMVSMNSTVKLTFRNTATFFGLHVTSTPLDLSYSQLTVATGTVRIRTHVTSITYIDSYLVLFFLSLFMSHFTFII